MRLRTASVIVLVALSTIASSLVASADTPPEREYLSLGTSLAAGSQIDEFGNTTLQSDWSYTDQLYQRISGRLAPNLVHEKLGCAGETADTISGGVNAFGQPSNCSYEAGSQLAQAVTVIAEGDVALITIDLGANDAVHTQQICGIDVNCIFAHLQHIADKVSDVVAELRRAGYEGPILAMNYYNPQVAGAIGFFPGIAGQQMPNSAHAIGSDQLAQALNTLLAQAYHRHGAEVVDVYSAYNAGDFGDYDPSNGVWDNVDVVCELTYMCPRDPAVRANIHLNKKGYKVVANAFFDAVKMGEMAA